MLDACVVRFPKTMHYLNLFSLLIITILNTRTCYSKWSVWNKELEWWQKTIIYQIYPRSFQDSDGDGVGDLKGIESRLDHFADSGIDTIWLSPIYETPMVDFGYDISNYTKIDPLFGTNEDFESLIRAVKKRNMYLLMDFVPNHSSDQHEWFKKSVKGIKPYKDYYMWHPGKVNKTGQRVPPNNWLSIFAGSGWKWNEVRKEYYFHQFSVEQPDFNLSNTDVQREMKDIMKFWLDLGCDGLRVDAVQFFFEDPALEDEDCLPKYKTCDDDYLKRNHSRTFHRPEHYSLLHDWRVFLDDYSKRSKDKHARILIPETFSNKVNLIKYYGNKTYPITHMPFNFKLIYITGANIYNASFFINYLNEWYDLVPEGDWGNCVTGNHDKSRVATRVGNEMVDGFFMLSMLLPGTAINYQGDELGQPDTILRDDQIRDERARFTSIGTRDPERGPFLWNGEANSGFTTYKYPWQPVHPSYWEINLEAQKKAKKSHFKIYQKLSALRKKPTIQRGSLQFHEISTWVFAFSRRLSGNETYVVVINIGSEKEIVTLSDFVPLLPEKMSIEVSSVNAGYEDGDIISTKALLDEPSRLLVLRPKASVVLSTKMGQAASNASTSAS